MSGAAQGAPSAAKATLANDSHDTSRPLQAQKPAAQLEEDDEFEDFPVEGKPDFGSNTLREGGTR